MVDSSNAVINWSSLCNTVSKRTTDVIHAITPSAIKRLFKTTWATNNNNNAIINESTDSSITCGLCRSMSAEVNTCIYLLSCL